MHAIDTRHYDAVVATNLVFWVVRGLYPNSSELVRHCNPRLDKFLSGLRLQVLLFRCRMRFTDVAALECLDRVLVLPDWWCQLSWVMLLLVAMTGWSHPVLLLTVLLSCGCFVLTSIAYHSGVHHTRSSRLRYRSPTIASSCWLRHSCQIRVLAAMLLTIIWTLRGCSICDSAIVEVHVETYDLGIPLW